MPQQPAVILTEEERKILESFVHRGKANARNITELIKKFVEIARHKGHLILPDAS